MACREQVKAVAPRAQLLFSFFEDTNEPDRPRFVTKHRTRQT